MEEKRIKIKGMTCVACAKGLERAFRRYKEVKEVSVNYLKEEMVLVHDNLPFSVIEKEIKSLGFAIEKKPKKSAFDLSLWLCLFFTIPLFYIAMAPMTSFLPIPPFLKGMENASTLAWIQLFLTLPVVILSYPIYKRGYLSLFRGTPNMDSLVALGTTASFLFSIVHFMAILNGYHASLHFLYFESTATILTLIQLGKFLERKATKKTKGAIEDLLHFTSKEALLYKDGQFVKVKVEELQKGHLIMVKTGEQIPVDGKLVKGQVLIDESTMTGESLPKEKLIGETLLAGTIVKNGFLEMEVTKVGSETVLSQIVAMVETAQNSKAPIAKLADAVSGYFTVIVLVLAVITAILWFSIGKDLSFVLTTFISVLVIACPCALGLATPIAIVAAMGKGASFQLLFKNAESLENLAKIDTIIFDKTGTLTCGKPAVTDFILLKGEEDEQLSLLVSLEEKSNHPLSHAILEYGKNYNISIKPLTQFETIYGKGLQGIYEEKLLHIGSSKFLQELGIELPPTIDKLKSEGKTVLLFAIQKEVVIILGIVDAPKKEAKEVVEKLDKLGISLYLATGDEEKTAQALFGSYPFQEIWGNLLPTQKSEKLLQLQKQGKKVAMVGDGINDAVALANSDVGISMQTGTDLAINSSDLVLMAPHLSLLVMAVRLSRKTMRIMKQNLFWAFLYNCLGIPIAMGLFTLWNGPLLNPMIAAFAMMLSSLSVTMNAFRLYFVKKKSLLTNP